MNRVDNAVILAAGYASRFIPLSYEKPKGLIEVKGEILIERQIEQLLSIGIKDIHVVTGYKASCFEYLKEKYNVFLIYNKEYTKRNNHSSIYAARHVINNTFVCSSDNYFRINPFHIYEDSAYYAVVYSKGKTNEWCVETDKEGYISKVEIGGNNSWYMMGHTFWNQEFSRHFLKILNDEYYQKEIYQKLWENILAEHITEFKMKARKYEVHDIYEFDTLEELRKFDMSYCSDTRSYILKRIADRMQTMEKEIRVIDSFVNEQGEAIGFHFEVRAKRYQYTFKTDRIE